MKIAIVAQHAAPCTRAPARARARTTDEARPSSLSMAGDARSGLARLTPNTLSKSVDVRSR